MPTYLTDEADNFFQLPESLLFEQNDFDGKLEKQQIVFADGEWTEGEEIKGRTVSVRGRVGSADRYSREFSDREIRFWASKKNLKLYRENTSTFIKLARLQSFDHKWVAMFDNEISDISITWQCDSPFWYLNDLRQYLFYPDSDPFSFNLDTTAYGDSSCVRGQVPIITVTADQGYDVPSFTIKNFSDDSLQLRYSDPNLTTGHAAIIDCEKGTVLRDDATHRTERYMEGEFLRLVNGVNYFEYQGPPATISILWRPRWL